MSDKKAEVHRLSLVVRSGPMAGHKFVVQADRPILIGRGNQAALQLEDPFVSAKHARIIYRQGQVVIEDLCSRNGTKVNGQPVELAVPLREGDLIALGQTELQYESLILDNSESSKADG